MMGRNIPDKVKAFKPISKFIPILCAIFLGALLQIVGGDKLIIPFC